MKRHVKRAEPARDRFARNLRTRRGEAGLSQEELGDRAGLHRTYIGSVERGERNISVDNMEQLARALGLDIIDLLAAAET
jgi:transcriptional regulator with XRE-family HTH domain